MKTFGYLDDPLATKKGLSPDAVAASPARAPAKPLSSIDEGAGDNGESGENGESGGSSGGIVTWKAKGKRSTRKPRITALKPAAPMLTTQRSTRARRAATRSIFS
jgi:hypothetical protein